MSKAYYAVVIVLVSWCFCSTAHCFNAEKEARKIIHALISNDAESVYRLSENYKNDEKQVKMLKSFQREQKRNELLAQYSYEHKGYFEIVNNNATVSFLEPEKKKLRNGKTDYRSYFSLSYDDKDGAGTDYNKKIKKCVIAVNFHNNRFSSLEILLNPAPEYW